MSEIRTVPLLHVLEIHRRRWAREKEKRIVTDNLGNEQKELSRPLTRIDHDKQHK
jgi:hypothetical protein